MKMITDFADFADFFLIPVFCVHLCPLFKGENVDFLRHFI